MLYNNTNMVNQNVLNNTITFVALVFGFHFYACYGRLKMKMT